VVDVMTRRANALVRKGASVMGELDRRRFLRAAVVTAGAAVVLEPLRFASAAPGAR
jgi:hypothetical protein